MSGKSKGKSSGKKYGDQFTPEEKRAYFESKKREATELMEQGLDALLDVEEYKNFLRLSARMHKYSAANWRMIWSQCRGASLVGGMKSYWNKMGRKVIEGSKPIHIWGHPFIKEAYKTEGGVKVVDPDRSYKVFPIVNVFDVSQTDGPEIVPTPSWSSHYPQGDGNDAAWSTLVRFFESQGVRVTVGNKDDQAGAHGYITGSKGHIHVSNGPKAGMLMTLLHEGAHYLDPFMNETSNAIRETIAQSAAFQVCHYLGIDCSTFTFRYLMGMAGEHARKTLTAVTDSLGRISTQLFEVLESLHPTQAQEAPQEAA